ncbi:MAG: hypothetical protein JNM84_15950, partial [Planctomycetes bacterium]|nr:hypothetical protein [Planctomycetota bacterium]
MGTYAQGERNADGRSAEMAERLVSKPEDITTTHPASSGRRYTPSPSPPTSELAAPREVPSSSHPAYMRISTAVFTTLLALPALASAQAPNNRHLFYKGEGALPNRFFSGTNFSTRVGATNTVAVECFSDLSASQFRGIGASSNTSCTVTGQVYIIQDNDGLTASPFQIILRSPVAPDGLPDGSAAGIIAQSGTLNTPVNTTAGGVAWQFSSTWATPVTVPCETGFYLGVSLPPGASATDVLVVNTASAINTTTLTGDNPRVPAPKWHAARVDPVTGVASRTTSQRTLAMVALTDQATLNIGNIDATVGGGYVSYGLGGLYPAVKAGVRDDGLGCRVEDGSNAGGAVSVFVSTGFLPGGFAFAGIGGALWCDPTTFISVSSGAIPAAAPFVYEAVMAPPGSIPPAAGLTVTFTAVTVGAGGIRFSN